MTFVNHEYRGELRGASDTRRGDPDAAELAVTRRDFLARWFGSALLGLGGSIFGAMAAYEGYARYSVGDLHRLNAGTSALLYPSRARLDAKPKGAVPGGGEPALFVVPRRVEAFAPPTKPLSIAIAAIELKSDCVELTTQVENGEVVWKTADHAVGHHTGTVMPGETGNSVMSGHISSPLSHQGNVFHRLPDLFSKLGSIVEISMQGGNLVRYEIVGTQVVTPNDIWVMDPTPTPILTLITCVPDGIYTHRLIVTGRLLS